MTPQPTTRRQAFTIAGLALLGASLAASARVADPPASSTVRDRLWVWGLDASFDWPAHEEGESPAKNRMGPVEGAVHLGVPNVMFIQYQGIPAAPFQQYYPPFKAMKQVYWTLSNNGNQVHELGQEQERVYQLAADNPNITGLLLDDFLIGPYGDNDDSHWLAANNATFPVSLVLSLPQEVVADSLVLTQTAWEGGGYRTAKFAVDVSRDGTNWQEVAAGELPDEAGATRKLSFPEQPLGFLRIRVLSSHDTQVAMSCGLKALAVFRQDQPISLTGTQFRASSEYPGHEALKLLLPRTAAGGGAKIFTSQVSTRHMESVSRTSKAAAKSASRTATSIALIHATRPARSSTPKQAACKCAAASSWTVTPPVTISCSKRTSPTPTSATTPRALLSASSTGRKARPSSATTSARREDYHETHDNHETHAHFPHRPAAGQTVDVLLK